MRYLTKKEKLSRFLIRERLARGLSQQEMAERVEASLRNYQRWERGEIFPYSDSWRGLEKFFGESLNEAVRADVVENAAQDRPLAGGQGDTMAVSPEEGEDDQAFSETFPGADEGKVGTAYSGPRMSSASQGGRRHKVVVLITILLVLGFVGVGIG